MGDNLYKFLTTILLGIVGFFCVRLVNDVSDIKEDVAEIKVTISADGENIRNNTKSIDRLNDKVFSARVPEPVKSPVPEKKIIVFTDFIRPDDVGSKPGKWSFL